MSTFVYYFSLLKYMLICILNRWTEILNKCRHKKVPACFIRQQRHAEFPSEVSKKYFLRDTFSRNLTNFSFPEVFQIAEHRDSLEKAFRGNFKMKVFTKFFVKGHSVQKPDAALFSGKSPDSWTLVFLWKLSWKL